MFVEETLTYANLAIQTNVTMLQNKPIIGCCIIVVYGTNLKHIWQAYPNEEQNMGICFKIKQGGHHEIIVFQQTSWYLMEGDKKHILANVLDLGE